MTILSEAARSNAAGFCWHVPASLRTELLGSSGLRLNDWLSKGRAQIVKHGPHRTVYHVTLPNLDFHLKHYRVPDARSRLRQWFRPSKARMEYERACAVQQRGVPTAPPIGFGEAEASGPGESYLLSQTLADAQPLNRYLDRVLPTLPAVGQVQLRLNLPLALARLLARMHDAGVTHHDLHAGNLLIRLGGHDAIELFLIDLHAVSLGPPLAWGQARANLVMLNRWFSMRAGRSERLRFWKEYHRLRAGSFGIHNALPELARDLESTTWQSNLNFWRRRDRRCLETNRYYQPVRSGHIAGYAVRELDPAELEALLRDPDHVFRRSDAVLLKDSRSSTVAEGELSVGETRRQVIYKRFRVTHAANPLLALFRPTAAMRSWLQGQGLRERALPTARPLLMLQRRCLGLPHEGYLVTEKVPEAIDLRSFAERLQTYPEAERRALLRGHVEQLARLVRELHRHGLSHRDLKAANILMSPEKCPWSLLPRTAPPLTHEPWLIDLVGITLHRRLATRRKVQNLARLHASFCRHPLLTRTDKLRFLRTYLQWGLLGRSSWKAWWRAVDAATTAKIAKNERNSRPLY